jgi:hypothetical protein
MVDPVLCKRVGFANNFLVELLVLRERVQTEHGQDVHVEIINHEPNITQVTSNLNDVFLHSAPQDQIDEYLGDLLQRLQIDFP